MRTYPFVSGFPLHVERVPVRRPTSGTTNTSEEPKGKSQPKGETTYVRPFTHREGNGPEVHREPKTPCLYTLTPDVSSRSILGVQGSVSLVILHSRNSDHRPRSRPHSVRPRTPCNKVPRERESRGDVDVHDPYPQENVKCEIRGTNKVDEDRDDRRVPGGSSEPEVRRRYNGGCGGSTTTSRLNG